MPCKRKNKNQPQIFENKSDVFEGKIYFKDPKKISEHLICGICQDVYDVPWSLTCGHTFCKSCITDWLKGNMTCPIDRSLVNNNFSHKNINLAKIIGDLIIACSWRPYGCDMIDRYYLIKEHLDKCKCNPNKMDPVMQAQLRKEVQPGSPIVLTATPTRPDKTRSGLDELMEQLENGTADESLIEDDLAALPELEIPSLAMRMYMKKESSREVILDLLDTTKSKTQASESKRKKVAG